MEQPVIPAYGRRSLAELTPSLLAALGMPNMPNSLDIDPVRRVCLLLIDGLGAGQLRGYAEDAPFLASLPAEEPLTAGFPASTPVSLASLGTGTPPGAHGILGLSFEAEHGELLDALKWTTHVDGKPVDQREQLPPEQVQPLETALTVAAHAGIDVRVVSSRLFEGSGLTRAALRGGEYRGVHALGDLAAELITALSGGAGPGFCYGYHADLDVLGHVYGPGSLPWRLQLSAIDRVAALVAEALPADGLLAVTADHGMVTVPERERINADTDPVLRAGVRLLGGDARARHVYAEPGAVDDVLAAWTERLGERAWVLPREEAIAAGWFGPVHTPQPRRRIGDVVVALRGDAAVIRTEAEKIPATFIGHHGSLTAAEQEIPLLLLHGNGK
ncbi:MAG: alkaline phosphatase family protein [Pseudonocardia sp.]|nr:alkaline phosphatase family protein [Pseudonocardia sp.]